MKVYANLLGSFVLLDNQNDMINGFQPDIFMKQQLHKYKEPFYFFTVIHNEQKYQISYNQLQSVEATE